MRISYPQRERARGVLRCRCDVESGCRIWRRRSEPRLPLPPPSSLPRQRCGLGGLGTNWEQLTGNWTEPPITAPTTVLGVGGGRLRCEKGTADARRSSEVRSDSASDSARRRDQPRADKNDRCDCCRCCCCCCCCCWNLEFGIWRLVGRSPGLGFGCGFVDWKGRSVPAVRPDAAFQAGLAT